MKVEKCLSQLKTYSRGEDINWKNKNLKYLGGNMYNYLLLIYMGLPALLGGNLSCRTV